MNTQRIPSLDILSATGSNRKFFDMLQANLGESDAADLVQQTFFTLIQHLHQIRDLSRIKCWLFTTLHRNFLMEVRHRAKHREVEFLPDVHGLQTEDPGQWSSLMRSPFAEPFCKSRNHTEPL